MTETEGIDSSHIVINGVFNAFLSYTAIMLNIITIHALRKTSSLPKPLKTLLLSLAVSDLGVGVLVQPLRVAFLVMRLKGNTETNPTYNNTKEALNVTSEFLCYASFFGVAALTADRFLAIHLHLRYQELVTHRRVVAVVFSIWVLSAILSPLCLLSREKILSIVAGTIPTVCLIFTAFFNCKIYLAVRRHKNQMNVLQVQQVTQNGAATNTARKIKSAVGTFYVYLVFLVCYLPFLIITVVKAVTGKSILACTVWEYTLTLVFLNSSLIPLVYCWKMRHIRHAIKHTAKYVFRRNN